MNTNILNYNFDYLWKKLWSTDLNTNSAKKLKKIFFFIKKI